jgi:hypothetical protein
MLENELTKFTEVITVNAKITSNKRPTLKSFTTISKLENRLHHEDSLLGGQKLTYNQLTLQNDLLSLATTRVSKLCLI